MTILINLSNRLGGGGLQVALSFLAECKAIPQNEYMVAVYKENVGKINEPSFPCNFHFFHVDYKKQIGIARHMKKIERLVKPDVVFTVFGPAYWTPRVPHVMGFAIPYYIYPKSPFFKTLRVKSKLALAVKKRIHLFLLRKEADAIVCETEDASRRIERILNRKGIEYFTVSNTCATHYLNFTTGNSEKQKLPARQKNEFRFLFVSRYYAHKNFELLPLVAKELHEQNVENISFVLTLPDEDFLRVVPDEVRKYFSNVGAIDIEDAPGLYSECDAIIQPSFLEVFSANYAEAMSMKKPIFASDFSFARSVCMDAAVYFNPQDINGTVEKLLEFVRNEGLRVELVKKGKEILETLPTARKRAESYLSICENAKNKLSTSKRYRTN